jgi:hypothetical protein
MRKTLGLLRQFGIEPLRAIQSLRGIHKYLIDIFKFLKKSRYSRISLSPILGDFHDNAGLATGHYFWQDLICAKWINDANPKAHFDVGSRVDGFIAHLLSFRDVTLLDIRNLENVIPNLTIIHGDAQIGFSKLETKFDSVSSLHSIEHFGLGRYGDTIEPDGHIKGLKNIANLVESGGHLYISFPIGKSKIEFNAQRIVTPDFPFEYLRDFTLEEFVLIPWKGTPQYNLDPHKLTDLTWGHAGLYKFKKKSD